MKKLVLTFAASVCLMTSGCMVKPPDDGLGSEVSAADVENALSNAETITDYNSAYRNGDSGTVLISTIVSTQSYPQDMHAMSVTSVTPTAVVFHDSETVYNQDGTTSTSETDYQIQKPTASPSPSPAPTASTSVRLKLPSLIEKPLASVAAWFKKVFSKISIQPSTAVATDSLQPSIHRSKADQELLDTVLRMSLAANQKISAVPLRTQSLTASDLAASPTPAQPTPDPGPQTTSRYFGLSVSRQPIKTTNCSQLQGCMTDGTHIEFKEIVTQVSSGTTTSTQVQWSYDISTLVPGLFIELNVCAGQIVNATIPVRQCRTVTAFHYGSS